VRLPTSEEMAALDRRAQEEFGIPTLLLMDAAGRGVLAAARRLVDGTSPRVVIVAGKGNNGGDGLVAARLMLAEGWRVTVLLVARDAEVSSDAAVNLRAARRAGVEIVNLDSTAVPGVRGLLTSADLLVDSLFGTGFKGPAAGLAAKTIEALNASGRPVLAVDIPSGVLGDSGAVEGQAVRASATVTMGLPKIGLLLPPGAEFAGKIWVADVGHPRRLVETAAIRASLLTRAAVDGAVPRRRLDAHKGQFGRVLVIAGSVGHTGAAVLATLGALRAGAGLVTVGVPASVYSVVGPSVIEGMPHPLPDADGALSEDAAARILELARTADAVACGPGLSTAPGPSAVVRRLVADCPVPLVLDADALNTLAAGGAWPDARSPLIITPHPGEMARLLGARPEDVQRHRIQTARVAADRFKAVVILKGARTIVADPAGDVAVVPTGNPGMASGGMGDVLTGAVAAFVGQGLAPAAAAGAAAYLHGLAGDLVAAQIGPAGILAGEVADALPRALAALRSGAGDELVTPLSVA
jgi:hydroxyethylthiazole kinase-like uncharacterized protein yjeF